GPAWKIRGRGAPQAPRPRIFKWAELGRAGRRTRDSSGDARPRAPATDLSWAEPGRAGARTDGSWPIFGRAAPRAEDPSDAAPRPATARDFSWATPGRRPSEHG